MLPHPVAALPPQPLAPSRIAGQPFDRRGHRQRIGDRDDQAGNLVGDRFANARQIAADHG